MFFDFPLRIHVARHRRIDASLLRFRFHFFQRVVVATVRNGLMAFGGNIGLSMGPNVPIVEGQLGYPRARKCLPVESGPIGVHLREKAGPRTHEANAREVVREGGPQRQFEWEGTAVEANGVKARGVVVSVRCDNGRRAIPRFGHHFCKVNRPLNSPLLGGSPICRSFGDVFFIFLGGGFVKGEVRCVIHARACVAFFPRFFRGLLVYSFLASYRESGGRRFDTISRVGRNVCSLVHHLPLGQFTTVETRNTTYVNVRRARVVVGLHGHSCYEAQVITY